MQSTTTTTTTTRSATSPFLHGRTGMKPRLGTIPPNLFLPHPNKAFTFTFTFTFTCSATHKNSDSSLKLVHQFDPQIPVEAALTPPSSWYTDPSFYSLELQTVFYNRWQPVGYSEQIKESYDYFTGRLGNVEFVVCRDNEGKIRAFHNVCRHHASLLACGSGKKTCFVCPYHGWTYNLGGNLLKAPRSRGLQKFDPKEFGLIPIKVATWGPFVIINLSNSELEADCDHFENDWLGSASDLLIAGGVDSSLSYIGRREYTIECNWKVFCDNYLDGGYHVPYAHKNLASGLNLDTYKIEDDKDFIERSLKDSEQVQVEDIILCEGVQRGIESPAYWSGRYAPTVEKAMHHFHCLLYTSLTTHDLSS